MQLNLADGSHGRRPDAKGKHKGSGFRRSLCARTTLLAALVAAAHAFVLTTVVAVVLGDDLDALQAAHVLRIVILTGTDGAMDALTMLFSMHFFLSPFLCSHSMPGARGRYAQNA